SNPAAPTISRFASMERRKRLLFVTIRPATTSGMAIRKTAVPTLTTAPRTTMTTEIQLLRARDLFVDNEVFLLGPNADGPDIELAGAAWIMARQPVEVAHLLTLNYSTALARAKLDG